MSSTAMVGVSSMYTSALQQQSTGGLTMVGSALAYGMSSGRGESGGIICCKGEWVVRSSQAGKLIKRFSRSVTLLDIVLQSYGQGVPPKVARRAMWMNSSTCVMLWMAVTQFRCARR